MAGAGKVEIRLATDPGNEPGIIQAEKQLLNLLANHLDPETMLRVWPEFCKWLSYPPFFCDLCALLG